MVGSRKDSLKHGEYICQGLTTGAEPIADIYMHIKIFFFHKELPYTIMKVV